MQWRGEVVKAEGGCSRFTWNFQTTDQSSKVEGRRVSWWVTQKGNIMYKMMMVELSGHAVRKRAPAQRNIPSQKMTVDQGPQNPAPPGSNSVMNP